MARSSMTRLLLALGMALSAGAPIALHGAPSAGAEQSATTDHRAAGDAALAAGQLERARKAYALAFAEERTFDVAGNLGAIYLALGQRRQAAEHLALALKYFPADAGTELRSVLERRLAEAARHVATVSVTAQPAGALLLVDGTAVGRVPLDQSLYLDPGAHSLELQGDDGTATQNIQLVAGQTERVELSSIQRPPDNRPAVAVGDGPNIGIVVGGSILTVAAAAVGAGFAVAAASRDSAAAEQGAALEQLALPDPCGSYPAGCDDIRSKQDSRDTFTAVAGVGLGVAAATLASTVIYGLLAGSSAAGDSSDSETSVMLIPTWATGSAGAAVRMRW